MIASSSLLQFIAQAQESVKSPMQKDKLEALILQRYETCLQDFCAKGNDAEQAEQLALQALGAPQEWKQQLPQQKKTSAKEIFCVALCVQAVSCLMIAWPLYQLLELSGFSSIFLQNSGTTVGNVGYSVGSSLGYALSGGLLLCFVGIYLMVQAVRFHHDATLPQARKLYFFAVAVGMALLSLLQIGLGFYGFFVVICWLVVFFCCLDGLLCTLQRFLTQ